jgi:hypothetical protein
MTEIAEVKVRRTVAGYLWRRRGCPSGDDQRDWYEAGDLLAEDWARKRLAVPPEPEDLVWEKWAREHLGHRPYLAIEAESDPGALADALQELHGAAGAQTTTALLAVLDGAPEYSRQCFRTPSSNGAAVTRVEAKDVRFWRFCSSTFALHGGSLLGKVSPSASNGAAVPRPYQDGCAVAFAEAAKAVAAALHLQRVLASCNEEEDRAWPERLHARVALGPSWESAVRCLCLAWRGETVVAPEILQKLGRSSEATSLAQDLLFAAGVRVGPRA